MSEEASAIEPNPPSWKSTKDELNVCRLANGAIDFDGYRKKKLLALQNYTGRPVVVYATDFLNQRKTILSGNEVGIDHNDLQGFAEVTKTLPPGPLDVIIHSPGGSPDAANSIVDFLRRKFTHIRFIVPSMAKSAATMIALSGDEILMPNSAELGPIDPQMLVPDGAGSKMYVPAKALMTQFENAKKEITENPRAAFAWEPILRIYSPALYERCKIATDLSKKLVKEWMQKWMFANETPPEKTRCASAVADYLADHDNFLSHGKRVSIEDLRAKRVVVSDLESKDPELWRHIEEAWYAVIHTFEGTGAFKLYESSDGQTWVRLLQTQVVMK